MRAFRYISAAVTLWALAGTAVAQSSIAVVVKDNSFASGSDLYLDCRSGTSCSASSQPQILPFGDHANTVAAIVRATADVAPISGQRGVRVISAVGADDNLINWLQQNAGAQGVRALVSTLGAGPGSCSPRYTELRQALDGRGVAVIWASGNQGFNGFAQGANAQIIQHTICGVPGVIDVGLAQPSAINPLNGLPCSDKRSACAYYSMWASSNFSTQVEYVVNTQGIYSGPPGTSFSAPVIAGAFAAIFRRNPTLSVDQAEQLIDQSAAPTTLVVQTQGPYLGQSFDYFEVSRQSVVDAASQVAVVGACSVTGVQPAEQAWFTDNTYANTSWQVIARGSGLGAVWATYTAGGQPTWYFINAERDACGVYTAPITEFRRNPASGVVTQTQIGTATLRFIDQNAGVVAYTIGGVARATSFQRYTMGGGPAALDLTGLWADMTRPNSSLYLQSEGTVHAAVTYIYDSSGAPTWTFGGAFQDQGTVTIPMYRIYGTGRCPTCSGAQPPVTMESAGNLLFAPTNGMLHVDGQLSLPGLNWQYPWTLHSRL